MWYLLAQKYTLALLVVQMLAIIVWVTYSDDYLHVVVYKHTVTLVAVHVWVTTDCYCKQWFIPIYSNTSGAGHTIALWFADASNNAWKYIIWLAENYMRHC